MATVASTQVKSSWPSLRQGWSKLVQAPGRALNAGLGKLTHLPAAAARQARVAAHDLSQYWQAAARSDSRMATFTRPRQDAPGLASRKASPGTSTVSAKEQFFAEHREQIRSGQYWARQDKSGNWQLAAHEANGLHATLEAASGALQRTGEVAYDLVTIPERLGEFAASPAGEAFRQAPEDLLIRMAANCYQQAKRLAVEIPSGQAEDAVGKKWTEATSRERGAFGADLVMGVLSLVPIPVARIKAFQQLAKMAETSSEVSISTRGLAALRESEATLAALPRSLRIEAGAARNTAPLTEAQKAEAVEYAQSLGMPADNIFFPEGGGSTAYWPGLDALGIANDVAPGLVPAGVGTLTANSRISLRGALAHEVVGHRSAALAGKTQEIDALEEAQASIRAARLAEGLTRNERYTLLRDGVVRLNRAGLRVREVKDQLWILEQ